MNILGVGPGELAVVFIIMLVVAGPKRMVQWAYIAGRYVAQLRAMFQQTMDAIQKEFADSGLDIRKDLPNLPLGRIDFLGEAAKIINPPNPPHVSAENTLKSADATDLTNAQQTSTGGESNDSEKPKYDSWLPN